MENKNQINVPEGTKELIIREGEALDVSHLIPQKVSISGTITAPRMYIEKRKRMHEDIKVHVLFSRENMQIKLICDEKNKIGTEITGKLLLNPELLKFKINTPVTYTLNELKQFLKMNRSFFVNVDENFKIVSNLEKVKISVQTQIEQEKDTRGNKTDNYQVKVDSGLEMSFNLDLPVYLGQPKKKFKVDICLDVRDKAVSVWLESVELREIEISERDAIINAELESFSDYVVIEQ